jgi:hypothetical protein
MSGMKISLDAAMRARDVSSTGLQDDAPLDRGELAGNATAARGMSAVASARGVGAADRGSAKQDSASRAAAGAQKTSVPPVTDSSERASVAREPIRSDTARGESISAPAQASSGDQRRRANSPRRRRRTRLRRGRPA